MTLFKKYTKYLLIVSLLPSCFSASVMSTAKTLDKGEQHFYIGGSAYRSSHDIIGSPEFMYRSGINKKSDFGIRYSLGLYGHLRTDFKYELMSWKNESNFISTGVGFDFYFPNTYSGDKYIVGSTIPLFFSFNHHKNVVPYIGQQYTFGWNDLKAFVFKNSNEIIEFRTSKSHSSFYSGTYGLKFEKFKLKPFIEVSYSLKIENNFSAWPLNNYSWENTYNRQTHQNLQLTIGIEF